MKNPIHNRFHVKLVQPRVLNPLITMKLKTKRRKKKITDSSSSSSNTSDSQSSDLHTSAVKIAVAQICKSAGYTGAQSSALETLTAVAVRFLRSLASSAASSAASTGRTQCNLYDVIRSLEDLHSNIGFKGLSNPNGRLYSLADSSILIETMKFVNFTDEIPFAKPFPRRCYTLPPNPPCIVNNSVKLNHKLTHVPRWLPDFPKIAGDPGKTVFSLPIGDETVPENVVLRTELERRISQLPEKRKKVSFTISGGGGGGNGIVMESGVDLRMKRISCQMYDDYKPKSKVNHI